MNSLRHLYICLYTSIVFLQGSLFPLAFYFSRSYSIIAGLFLIYCWVPLHCVIDSINRKKNGSRPEIFFFAPGVVRLSCPSTLTLNCWKGCRCKRALSQCGWCMLNGPVHSSRVRGLLWNWGALIHSQITSNCLKQKLSLSWACLLTGPFAFTAENYQDPPSDAPLLLHRHTPHIYHLPPWQFCGLLPPGHASSLTLTD